METLKEKISYITTPITICMKDFSHMEQYEIVRLLFAHTRKDVSICTHDSTSPYMNEILQGLPIKFTQCYLELPVLQTFDLQVDRLHHE